MATRRPAFAWSRASFNASASRVGDIGAAAVIDPLCVKSKDASTNVLTAPGSGFHFDAADSELFRPGMRTEMIAVHPEIGAGLEVSFAPERGYIIEDIAEMPGQQGLAIGDLIVAINGRSLALQSEDDADDILASEIADGVGLLIAPPTSGSDVGIPKNTGVTDLEVWEQSHRQRIGDASEQGSCGTAPPTSEVLLPTCVFKPPSRNCALEAYVSECIGELSNRSEPSSGGETSGEIGDNKVFVLEPTADCTGHVGEQTTSDCPVAPSPEALPPASCMFRGSVAGIGFPEFADAKHNACSDSTEADASSFSRRPHEVGERFASQDVCTEVRSNMSAASLAHAFLDVLATDSAGHGLVGRADIAEELPPQPRFAIAQNASQRPGPSVASDLTRSLVHCSHPVPEGMSSSARTESVPSCKVAELWDWLSELCLQEYFEAATTWCVEMGAVSIEELAENAEDFADDVSLKLIERRRLQKWAANWLDIARAHERAGRSVDVDPAALNQLSRRAADSLDSKTTQGCTSSRLDADTISIAEGGSDPQGDVTIYASRTVRLAMDKQGSTGLELRWDEHWGIAVTSLDPLPGQPGLKVGDYIVAIDGCSLRNRSHEETDQIFSEKLRSGASLSVLTPSEQAGPASLGGGGPRPRFGPHVGQGHTTVAPLRARNLQGGVWKQGWGSGRRGLRGGFDANRMWKNFKPQRGPPW